MIAQAPFVGPFDDVVNLAEELLNENDQSTIFQIWQCSECGRVQQHFEPNTFIESGTCLGCGRETDLRNYGCGCLAIIGDPEKVQQAAAEAAFAQYGKPTGQPS